MSDSDSAAGAPPKSPIQPQELDLNSEFHFDCHKSIACFNACCRNIDITLMPYDILRLKRRLKLDSREFVARYTVPFEMDFHGMPGLKVVTKPGTQECVFLSEEGCTVYEDRPSACRYYALGSMGVRPKDKSQIEDIYFVVKEDHCLGHQEAKHQTVGEYRLQQGLGQYDEMNRVWRDLIIKKRSSGPTVGAPSPRSMQLFDMCSYDMDSFKEFVESEGFQTTFDLDEATQVEILDDEDARLKFAIRFLQQVFFGEQSIPLKEGARERRVKERKAIWEKRREETIDSQREDLGKQQYEQPAEIDKPEKR